MTANWCYINYFEHNLKVGDSFKLPLYKPTVIIDGLFDLCSKNRLCLGAISNVKRTEVSEIVLMHIGRGVKFEYFESGEVYCHVLGNHSIFIESYYLDTVADFKIFSTVHQLYPGNIVKVFDMKLCTSLLSQHFDEVKIKNYHFSNDYLKRFCVLRFSFIKGWGPDFARKKITETPCWCEIQLNKPLQLLDKMVPSILSFPFSDDAASRELEYN